jgi:hypothetical protein
MNNNEENIWKSLMDAESSMFSNPSLYNPGNKYMADDDDFEDFLTSKEINPKDDKREKHLGTVGTGDGPIEEDVHFKRFTTKYEHKYTEKELEAMRASCAGTIVHDYSEMDIYHMSDEYRKENDMLNELSGKLHTIKGTYRKVDAWIEAMRVVVQAWEMLESKGNYIHTKKEFFELVSEGKIVSNRIIMPKLKRMNNYDLDTLIKYISNPELDPADLMPLVQPSDDDKWYASLEDDVEEETEEEKMERLLSPEEAEYILIHADAPESFKVKDIKHKLIRGYDKKNYQSSSKKKKNKKQNKIEKYRQESLHDILNKIQSDPNNRSDYAYINRSFMIANSMFEPIKAPKSFFDDIKFDGSWTDEDALFLYDIALREEMLKQHPSRSKYMTFADQELQQFFKLLEDNGVNTLNLRRKMDAPADGAQSIEEKATKKENKKIESAIIQRITKLNSNPKFKKIVAKAENALNKQFSEY